MLLVRVAVPSTLALSTSLGMRNVVFDSDSATYKAVPNCVSSSTAVVWVNPKSKLTAGHEAVSPDNNGY